jgi:hypothetical protein
MLAGAGLARLWPHDRAHWFFARARWNADALGLAAAKLVVALLVPSGEPVCAAADDTLFRRRGKKVWAASWFHDGSAQGPAKTGRGNNWVVLAVIVRLPFCTRPVALPVLAKLVIKGTQSSSRLWLARRMTQMLADALPGRDIHVTARFRLRRRAAEEAGQGRHLDHPAAQGRRPARPAPGPHREAGTAPREGRPTPVPGAARRHGRVHSGHRHPLRKDRHDRRRGRHL